MTVPTHPATFSDVALERIARILDARLPWEVSSRKRFKVVDPFAGIGTIHRLQDDKMTTPHLTTIGIELEPEWAAAHPRNREGDAANLGMKPDTVDAFVYSPAFGNRMADSYDGKGRCKRCDGTGARCEKCDGTGVDQSKRATYRISLGRELSDGSGAAMQWGEEYRSFHRQVISETLTPTKPGGLHIVDIKDHQRAKQWQGVPEWWAGALAFSGLRVVDVVSYPVESMRFGTNGEARADHAYLIVAVAS